MNASNGLLVSPNSLDLGCLWEAELTRLGGLLVLDVSALDIVAGDSFCLFSGSKEGDFSSIELVGVTCMETSLQADGSDWSLIFEDHCRGQK